MDRGKRDTIKPHEMQMGPFFKAKDGGYFLPETTICWLSPAQSIIRSGNL